MLGLTDGCSRKRKQRTRQTHKIQRTLMNWCNILTDTQNRFTGPLKTGNVKMNKRQDAALPCYENPIDQGSNAT
jgi:hypothetical protein